MSWLQLIFLTQPGRGDRSGGTRFGPGSRLQFRTSLPDRSHFAFGRERKAKAQASDLLLRDPKCTIARTRANNPFRHEWMISYFLDALALAGVPVRLKVSRQDPLSRGRAEEVPLIFSHT